jgi:hypothetical protein
VEDRPLLPRFHEGAGVDRCAWGLVVWLRRSAKSIRRERECLRQRHTRFVLRFSLIQAAVRTSKDLGFR